MKYIVCLEKYNDIPTTFIATWRGDPGRTCIEKSAKRYDSVSSATFGLAHARKYHDFPTAEICEVTE